MKVMVTGASGFVGQHVVVELLRRGHVVTAVGRHETKASNFAWFDHVRFIESDIHCPIINPFETLGRPEVVMHLAWTGLPNYSSLFHFEQNLPADYRFLKALIEGGTQQVLVTGTCLEYGMQSGELPETRPTRPTVPYGLAKDTLNKFLKSLKVTKPFTLQWCRLFYMHGIGQNPKSLLSQLDRAIDNGSSSFNMSHGEQLRDYLPVQVVAKRLVNVLEHSNFDGEINICSGKPISVRDLAMKHLYSRGKEIKLNLGYYPYPDYEPMEFWGKTEFSEFQKDRSCIPSKK